MADTTTFDDIDLDLDANLSSEAHEPTAFDEDDSTGHDVEADETDSDAADLDAAGSDVRSGARVRRPISKQSAAKAIAKYLELVDAPGAHLEVLGVTLGARADAAELAAVIVSSPRINLSALNDVLALADATSPYAAMLEAMKLSREQLRSVWALLAAVDVVSGTLPAKDSAAAIAAAEASASIGSAERGMFDAARTLSRK